MASGQLNLSGQLFPPSAAQVRLIQPTENVNRRFPL